MRVLDLFGGAEVMSESDCREFLRQCRIGRLATSSHGVPDVAPVNYRWDGSDIVVESNVGHKLLAASGSVVAFEVDRIDETTMSGSSVIVHGEARVEPLAHAGESTAWSGPKDYLIRIHPRSITGRRVGPPRRR